MKRVLICVIAACLFGVSTKAQQDAPTETRVALNDRAVALDANNSAALEATLSTRALHGDPDTPVSNIRMIVRNAGAVPYAFVSGLVTFYDVNGVRCGEGIFKSDALAVNESFETDTPGIRIRCSPTHWRIVATNLLPRVVPIAAPSTVPVPSRLVLSVDGESHPIQLDRPITVTLGERQRTIVLRAVP